MSYAGWFSTKGAAITDALHANDDAMYGAERVPASTPVFRSRLMRPELREEKSEPSQRAPEMFPILHVVGFSAIADHFLTP